MDFALALIKGNLEIKDISRILSNPGVMEYLTAKILQMNLIARLSTLTQLTASFCLLQYKMIVLMTLADLEYSHP